jgi:hypothetical protein
VKSQFRWRAAQLKPLQAATGSRYGGTADVVNNAIAEARSHPDDDVGALNMIRSVPGFGLPMASVFLALYFPDRFTIADRRALQTLRK